MADLLYSVVHVTVLFAFMVGSNQQWFALTPRFTSPTFPIAFLPEAPQSPSLVSVISGRRLSVEKSSAAIFPNQCAVFFSRGRRVAAETGRMKEGFSVKVEDGREGRDGSPSVGPLYRSPLAARGFPPPGSDMLTSWDILRASVDKFPENRMLGWREIFDGKLGPYQWKTYKKVYDDVLHVACALRASGAEPGTRVGIYGPNCPQWVEAMEACNAHSLICVPLYDTLGSGAVNFIIDHAEIDFVFVDHKKAEILLQPECASAQRLKSVVCFSSFEAGENFGINFVGTKFYSWDQFLQLGKENPLDLVPPQPLNICTIMYTSGTSGDPKGVILTHENTAEFVRGVDIFLDQFEEKMTMDDVYLSFLPLAHILDRMIEEYFFHKGASIGYYHGDINALKDDLMELKPTLLAAVPRVLERIYEGIQTALQDLNPIRRTIFNFLYKYKLAWMNLGFKQKKASPFADILAFRKVKVRLGGRVRLILSGGAPLGTEVEEFLRVTSCALVVQGYGLTETCGISTIGFPDEMCMVGAVGVPFVSTEVRLVGVPDMGYDPLEVPSRGELCVRGTTLFSGYFKDPDLTRESFRDGWFHTGDVGEMLPNGVIKIIDRKKNLIKLSQGEYVALDYLEKVYSVNPFVEDIWIYGNGLKSALVAVVVPNRESAKRWAEVRGCRGSFGELCVVDDMVNHILYQLNSTADKNKLRGFERVKGLVLESEPFERDPNLVTPTLKKRRDRMLKRYQAEVDRLYDLLLAAGKST